MPPERTTHSFAAASAAQLPLSSHGPNHIPSLRRGGACLVCRTRKLKCDGVTPACTSCTKSAVVHGDDPAFVVCNYEKGPAPKAAPRRHHPDGDGDAIATLRLVQLEKENARLKSALADAEHQASRQLDNHQLFPLDAPLQSFNWNPAPKILGGDSTPYLATFSLPDTPPSSDPLLDIFWPGWYPDLPSPALVERLVDVFFSRHHFAAGMMDPGLFRTALRLPPMHYSFPHASLLHATLATAGRLVSDEFFETGGKYWVKEDPHETITGWHMKRAQAAIQESMTVNPVKLYHVFQALVLISFNCYVDANFMSVWYYSGLAMKLCTPLGLNHVREGIECHGQRSDHDATIDREYNEVGVRDQAMMFWLALSIERLACASTGWASALDDRDITSLLPAPLFTGKPPDLASSPLSSSNPTFLTSHPSHLVKPLQLYLKAFVLLGKVISFLQRLPPPIGLGLPNNISTPLDGFSAEGGKLHAACIAFCNSIPHNQQIFSTPGSESSFCYVVLTSAVGHTATTLFHEPFCSTEAEDFSLAQCITSARAILGGVHVVLNSSFEIPSLAPSIIFCWAVCGRTLVRELAVKAAEGDFARVVRISSEVCTVIRAMRAHSSALGECAAAALGDLLANPTSCLPTSDIRHAATGVGFSEGHDSWSKAKKDAKEKAAGPATPVREATPGGEGWGSGPTLAPGFELFTELGEMGEEEGFSEFGVLRGV